ncbi:MAG: hypothetical protein WAO28_04155 [Candidatus Microsaccharimonas sp.]
MNPSIGMPQMPMMPQQPPRRSVNVVFILMIVFIATTVIALGIMIWALVNYFDQKDNVDTKVADAVSIAKKEQADADEAKFLERDKQPNRQFVGPEDYGRVSFDYPKTWSVYVAKDASNGGNYEAYLNPVSVPTVVPTQQYALRVTIEEKDYDQVVSSYTSLVSKGDLTTSSIKADEQNGTRLDGSFSKNIRGSAVIFKIRDKTVTIRTDADTFKADFDALITTITFNK